MTNSKNWLKLLAMALVFGTLFTSCGTIMKKKQITVTAESGAAAAVTIVQDGINLYSGPLPARIDVSKTGALSKANPKAVIIVNYTDRNGNQAVFEIKKTFNWWALGSLGGAGVGIVVDVITGSIFTYNFSKTAVPISLNYAQPETEIWFADAITLQMMEYLTYAGNIYE